MQNRNASKVPHFEKALAALGISMPSESVFTMTIFNVTVLAIVSLFLEVRR